MCNQSTWANLWNCIRRTYLTIKNHQRKIYKMLTSWRIQDTKTKLDDKKQCFYIPVKFLVTHEYKKPKRWHANMYLISQKNYNHLFATKHMWKAEKIKKITYPRKGTCVCKHLFITCPAVFQKSNIHCDNVRTLLFFYSISESRKFVGFLQMTFDTLQPCSYTAALHCKNIRRFYDKVSGNTARPFPVIFTGARKHFQESGTVR